MSTSSTRPAAAHRLILAVLVPALMAAALVAAGGGKDQGPDRERERREAAGKRSAADSRIESEIESRITRDARIDADIVDALEEIEEVMPNAVTVRVDGGVVTLSGAVPDRRAREEVYEAALYTSGVTEIREELVIEPESRGTE